MSVLAGWQDAYYMEYASSISHSPSFSDAAIGGAYGLGKPLVYLSNHPTFDINKGVIFTRKATGRSYIMRGSSDHIERTPGTVAPTTTYEMDLDPSGCFIPLLTLFQPSTSGATHTDAAADTAIFYPYTVSTVSQYASLLRVTDTGQSHQILGAVAKTISISGEEGDSIKYSVEWTGANMSTGVSSTVTAWADSTGNSFLLFQDLTFVTGTTMADMVDTVDITGFDITITNNVVAKHYDDVAMQRHILGNFEVSGTIKVPWSSTHGGQNSFLSKLIAGTDFLMCLYWGSSGATSAGQLSIIINAEVDSVNTSGGEDEAVNEIAFTGIYDAVNYPIEIRVFGNVPRTSAYWTAPA
jgi:hypothetical protein